MKGFVAALAALALGACVSVPPPFSERELNPLAERFVKLTLQIGVKEDGYVDAYHGPPAWAEAAKAAPLSVTDLKREAATLEEALAALSFSKMPGLGERRSWLLAHVRAARYRLRMIEGKRGTFFDEAEALFGVRPEAPPLASFAPVIARVDALVPGEGALPARLAAFRKRYEIPADRLRPVMEAAIAECRRRTAAHIALPEGETFTLSFVTGKPWSGYNWFEGDAKSRIEINTDLPITIDRAVDLGCHEGYPGHHVHNILMEKLYREKGWVEFSVWPLFAPVGFIAEGSANAGVALAFPDGERLAFEQRVLYPLAGLDPAGAPAYAAVTEALAGLRMAEIRIAADYLAGRIDRAGAIAALERTQLVSPERAAKRVDFIDAYRSYIINYSVGQAQVAAYLERRPPEERWAALTRLLSEPTTPWRLGR